MARRDGISGVQHVVFAGSSPEERLFVIDARGRARRFEDDGAPSYPIALPTSEPTTLRRLGSRHLCCESADALIVIDPATLSQVAKVDLPGRLVAASPAGPRIAVKIDSRVEILELTLAATATVPSDPLVELIAREGSVSEYVARRDHSSRLQPLLDAGMLVVDAGRFELSWDGWMRSTRATEARAAASDLDAAIRSELGRREPSSMIDFARLCADLALVDRDLQLLRSVANAIGFGTVESGGLVIPTDTDTRLAFHAASLETWLDRARIQRGRTFADVERDISAFEMLAVSAQSDERKTIVRRLESDIRDKAITLSLEQFRRCRASHLALARILAYLYVEHARIEGGLDERRQFVVHEWEYLQRLPADTAGTMMPLYYAIRCYRALLKTHRSSNASADLPMFAQIRSALARGQRDAGMQVRNAIEEIEQLLPNGGCMTSKPPVDVGILTIRDDEFEAVLDRFPDEDRPGLLRMKRHYNMRLADAGNGHFYHVAILRQLEQGNGEALAAARDLLEDLSPRLLIVIGIAGGVPHDDFTLGDVIVSTRIHDYSVEQSKESEAPTYASSGGSVDQALGAAIANLRARRELAGWADGLPRRPDVDATPEALVYPTVYGSDSWQTKVRKSLKAHFVDRPRGSPVHQSGVIATSDRLVKNTSLLIPWLATSRNILAVEMESGGVYRAAQGRAAMVAIRGISDIVGYVRSDDWTKYACHSAAAFARVFLRTTPIEPMETLSAPAVRS
jgi:nucleoside phosphorylase